MEVRELRPSDFCIKPWSCIFRQSEYETIALNIMKILKKYGDEFDNITWEEYRKARLEDGNFSEREKSYFDRVVDYCTDPNEAKKFSKDWGAVI
jgi:hypothetical protein